jgi:diguanylate cyclase (GGDEF)-like protein/PAS domain S-box-containing protein
MWKQAEGSLRLQWGSVILALLVFGGFIAANLYSAREQLLERERNRLLTQAHVLTENLGRQLAGIDSALVGIRAELATAPESDRYPAAMNRQLTLLDDAIPGVRSFNVLDANGIVQLSSRPDFLHRNFKERVYVQQAVAARDPNIVLLSAPFATTAGPWAINLSRVMLDAKGDVAGIVSATLDQDYFKTMLGSVNYASDMRSAIVHGDGLQFAMMPGDESAAGKNLAAPNTIFSQYMRSGKTAGIIIGEARPDAPERMIALQTIKPDDIPINKPLVVAIIRNMADITQPWRRGAIRQGAIFVVVCGLSVVALVAFQRQRRVHYASLRKAHETIQQSERDLRLVLDNMPSVINYWDRDLRNRFGNSAHLEWFGIDPATLPGMHMRDVTSPQRFALNLPYIEGALRGEPQNFERIIPKPDGTGVRHALIHYVPDNVDGEVRGFYAMVSDVSALKEAEAALKESSARYNDLVRRLPVGVSTFRIREDGTSTFDYASPRYQELLGIDIETLRTDSNAYFAAVHPDDLASLRQTNDNALRLMIPFVWNGRFVVRGETRWINIVSNPVMLPNGDTQWNGVCRDITDQKRSEAIIEEANILLQQRLAEVQRLQKLFQEQAARDGLTGLYNRRYFDETLAREIARARRDDSELALVLVDVDHFKKVNDTHGHQAGDAVLKKLAELLTEAVRAEDIACRYGGEEFAIIMPTASAAGAVQKAESWREAFSALKVDIGNGQLWQGTMSLGVACFPIHAGAPEDLIARADAALYKAKHQGRNRTMAFDETMLA